MNFLLGILLWIAVLLPFFLLGYVIFLVRENRKYKYTSVNKLILIVLGVFIANIALYYLLPKMFSRSTAYLQEGVEQGKFVNEQTGDTLMLQGNMLTINYKQNPERNTRGNYRVYKPNPFDQVSSGDYYYFEKTYIYQLLNHFSFIEESKPVLELSYKQFYTPPAATQKSKKQNSNKNAQSNYNFVVERFHVTVEDNKLILKNTSYTTDVRRLVRI